MADNLERFRQSPEQFRTQILCWLKNPYAGGEIGKAISQFIQKRNWHFSTFIEKGLRSRVGRAIIILLIISGVVLLIKKKTDRPEQSIAEILFDNSQSIAVVSAGLLFMFESSARQKRDQYEAWQVINSALEQSGSGGRIQAIEDLNKDGVDLKGLAAPRAYLSGINLSNGMLIGSNLEGTQLFKANLRNAILMGANLQKSDLRSAQLQGTVLSGANLQEALLLGANLQGAILVDCNLTKANLAASVSLEKTDFTGACLRQADLRNVSLQYARLFRTDLQEANLRDADLQYADFTEAKLQGALLWNAKLQQVDFSGADLHGTILIEVNLQEVVGWTEKHYQESNLCRTMMPDGIVCDRDCKALGISKA